MNALLNISLGDDSQEVHDDKSQGEPMDMDDNPYNLYSSKMTIPDPSLTRNLHPGL